MSADVGQRFDNTNQENHMIDTQYDVSTRSLGRSKSKMEIFSENNQTASFELSDNNDNSYGSLDQEFNSDYALMMLERFQEMDEFQDWEIKFDEPHIKVWKGRNGSFLSSELPFLHTEMIFGAQFPFNLIVESINSPDRKKMWDFNIQKSSIVKNLSLNEVLYHTVYKELKFRATKRDFVEKKLTFSARNIDQDEIVICLSSSIPDEYFPPEVGITR